MSVDPRKVEADSLRSVLAAIAAAADAALEVGEETDDDDVIRLRDRLASVSVLANR